MKKRMKITILSVLIFLGACIAFVGGYCLFVIISYKRIGNKKLNIENRATEKLMKIGSNYTCTTYNIGFGAYSQDYTFFMDTGYDENNNLTKGYYSKARSKKDVLFNTNGVIETIKNCNIDFAFFQEVDEKADRSKKVNQKKQIMDAFNFLDGTFCVSYHTPYLPYPIYDMHGAAISGLLTLSRFQIESSQRYEFTISNSLSKLFDLDRCFSVSRIKVENNKYFNLVNIHLSAYDKDGKIREKQMEELNSFLELSAKNGDYVLVGGDFNHDLLINNPDYDYSNDIKPFNVTLKSPDWLFNFFNDQKESPLIKNYRVIASDNYPTCRNNDIEWIPGKTFVCVVDGFIVSDNIEVIKHENIRTENGNKGLEGFAYSDHDPALLEFRLK